MIRNKSDLQLGKFTYLVVQLSKIARLNQQLGNSTCLVVALQVRGLIFKSTGGSSYLGKVKVRLSPLSS